MISEWNSERIQYHPACLHVSLLFSGGGGVLLIEDVDVQCPRKKRVFFYSCVPVVDDDVDIDNNKIIGVDHVHKKWNREREKHFELDTVAQSEGGK